MDSIGIKWPVKFYVMHERENMNIKKILVTGLLLVSPIFCQSFCSPVVSDLAHELSSDDIERISAEAQKLINLGMEPHIITVDSTGNLDFTKAQMQSACIGWQSPDGHMKSTLILLMDAPHNHKLGIYIGSAWNHALGDSWNRIKTDYMAPHFRDRQPALGFIAAMEQIGKRVVASQDETTKGVSVVNQATDLTGLWAVLNIFFILAGFGLLLWLLWRLFVYIGDTRAGSAKEKQNLKDAQQGAILARNTVADRLTGLKRSQEDAEATGAAYASKSKYYVDDALEAFQRLSSAETTNPEDNGKSMAQYWAIRDAYFKVDDKINSARSVMSDVQPEQIKYTTVSASTAAQGPVPVESRRRVHIHHDHYVSTPQPVIVHDNSGDFVSGMLVGEALSDTRRRDYEDYRPAPPVPSYDPTPSYSSSSSSSSDSGGSSDYGSSSSYDSGSSSDYGSSSDSGGSSDY